MTAGTAIHAGTSHANTMCIHEDASNCIRTEFNACTREFQAGAQPQQSPSTVHKTIQMALHKAIPTLCGMALHKTTAELRRASHGSATVDARVLTLLTIPARHNSVALDSLERYEDEPWNAMQMFMDHVSMHHHGECQTKPEYSDQS